ncbi:MAG TPA: acetylornithine deacetylase [Propionibacteriaceae bacterium]|nr:acetylornithine deacetylase [Propionibacteriaceae bacterium]
MPSPSEPRSLPWITRLVSLDTTSRDSNLHLVNMVADEFRSHGLDPHIFPTVDGRKANLICTIPARDGGSAGGVVISGHTDVVPVDGQDWASDPFTPEIRDGRLYGRGTADMKSWIGVALTLLPEMVAAELVEPLHFALTYDEEVGCVGGDAMVEQMAQLGLSPRAVLVGEPSSMQVIRAHKSINVFQADFTGVAAHSSLPTHGVNAIEYAASLIRAWRDRLDDWRANGPFDDAYPVSWTTGGVNQISGGIAVNTVPDHCRVTFEFRAIKAVSDAGVQSDARAFCDTLRDQMRAEHPDADVTFTVLAAVPGLDTDAASPAVALAHRLGGIPTDGKVTYGTEAGQFQGAGFEAVVVGPGDIARAHAANEYVELSQIAACEVFLGRLIEVASGRD